MRLQQNAMLSTCNRSKIEQQNKIWPLIIFPFHASLLMWCGAWGFLLLLFVCLFVLINRIALLSIP